VGPVDVTENGPAIPGNITRADWTKAASYQLPADQLRAGSSAFVTPYESIFQARESSVFSS